jgi:phosphoribosylformimino-5-aminoimidazole carboxamide ribonucleotide (ProFAR) isomerase
MSLGNVINALAENANHGGKKKIFIPYRNSKLTRVLQNSLGGNSLCSMLATTSPSLDNLEESLSTLNYANRAKMIKVEATKNEEMTQIDALKDEVTLLKQKLQQMATQPVNVGGGLADQEKMKMKAEYEAQLQELKSHMNQNWEDKSSKSKKYEKERQLLLAKNREEQKQLQRQFELEKQKRWALMEEKGDIAIVTRCGNSSTAHYNAF